MHICGCLVALLKVASVRRLSEERRAVCSCDSFHRILPASSYLYLGLKFLTLIRTGQPGVKFSFQQNPQYRVVKVLFEKLTMAYLLVLSNLVAPGICHIAHVAHKRLLLRHLHAVCVCRPMSQQMFLPREYLQHNNTNKTQVNKGAI